MPTTLSPNGRLPHILVLDNDAAVLSLFRDLLGEEGYSVTTQTHADHDLTGIIALQPDLIVLDYRWSTEDTSWSLLHLLRKAPQTTRIPIVLCTGAAQEIEALSGQLAEMAVQVVLKPFDIEEMFVVIASALARAGAYGIGAHGRTVERYGPHVPGAGGVGAHVRSHGMNPAAAPVPPTPG
jgi:two-component system phosphate regulon response regulator PhoB